jgi:hypothetical protein
MGQALHTGLWSNKHGNSISISMPRKEGAHLYATSYWNRGVLLASTMQLECREAVATALAIRDLDFKLPTISPIISARLYQHPSRKLNESRVDADHHGWEGAASHLLVVGTTTVTDPVSGEEVPFIPRRRHPGHVPAMPQRFRDVLNSLAHIASFFEASERRTAAAHLVAQPWHFLVTTGACSGHHCPRKGKSWDPGIRDGADERCGLMPRLSSKMGAPCSEEVRFPSYIEVPPGRRWSLPQLHLNG